MDKEINELLNEFARKASAILTIEEIILYGSFARGTQHENSDIDVAVIIKELKGDFLDNSSLLFKIVSKIDSRIEPVLLLKNHDSPGFIDHIKSYGIRVYPFN